MEFHELNLHSDLQKGIDEAGFTTCMPVQEMVFGHSLAGEDIYAQSQTGTGKTAAFLISIMQRIMTVPELRAKKALILAPTRELAVQIEAEVEKLGKHLSIKAGSFYGGVSYGPQVDKLRDDVQILVGTPGRIIDLVTQGKMLLKDVGFLVIDEADRMFDMGFIDDLRKIIRYLPAAEQRQTYLFSATLGLRVKDLAWEYMRDPSKIAEIAIEPEHITVDLITQELYHVGSHEKLPLLLGLLNREKPESCIIFCNQKFMVEELARRLRANGYPCEYIMGDLPQAKRLEVIERLKAGAIKMLVATDVAARGLDIEALDLVVNYDVPEEAESYVHRIGRTARAGKSGKAITLACEKFVYGLYGIEKYLGTKIPVAHFDESLLLSDKSEGMRFSHDRGGEGRGRDQRERGGRSQGRGPSYGSGRSQPRSNEGQRREPPRSSGPRQDRRPNPPRKEERAGQGNPYSLSQDERMKAYKAKYGGNSKPDSRRQGGGKPQDRAARPQNQNPRPQGQKAKPQNQKAKPQNVQAQSPAKKPGLLDRIRKIFSGKK